MLTPQEVNATKFEKSIFGGYDMAGVDDFLDKLTEDYTELYKENVTLKSKMKVLVEKIEEYRSVDDAMRKALLTAQNMANEMKDNAKKESDAMINSAKAEAEKCLLDIQTQIEAEEQRLGEAKKKTLDFLHMTIGAYGKDIERLSELQTDIEPEVLEYIKKAKESAAKQEFKVELPVDIGDEQEEPAASDGDTNALPDLEDTAEIDDIKNLSAVIKGHEAEKKANDDTHMSDESNGMKTQMFEIDMDASDGRDGAAHKDFDSIENEDDMVFTPKPKFHFEELKFGSDYKEEE